MWGLWGPCCLPSQGRSQHRSYWLDLHTKVCWWPFFTMQPFFLNRFFTYYVYRHTVLSFLLFMDPTSIALLCIIYDAYQALLAYQPPWHPLPSPHCPLPPAIDFKVIVENAAAIRPGWASVNLPSPSPPPFVLLEEKWSRDADGGGESVGQHSHPLPPFFELAGCHCGILFHWWVIRVSLTLSLARVRRQWMRKAMQSCCG